MKHTVEEKKFKDYCESIGVRLRGDSIPRVVSVCFVAIILIALIVDSSLYVALSLFAIYILSLMGESLGFGRVMKLNPKCPICGSTLKCHRKFFNTNWHLSCSICKLEASTFYDTGLPKDGF